MLQICQKLSVRIRMSCRQVNTGCARAFHGKRNIGRSHALRLCGGTHMSLDRFHRMVSIAAILLLFLGTDALASSLDEPQYLGKTVDYWIKVIRDRDEQKISLAFDAIRALGPDAQAAVPDLIAIVVAPFTPILIGTDSQTGIASKIYES